MEASFYSPWPSHKEKTKTQKAKTVLETINTSSTPPSTQIWTSQWKTGYQIRQKVQTSLQEARAVLVPCPQEEVLSQVREYSPSL